MAGIRSVAVWLYVLGAALLFGGTVYQMVVVVPAFAYDLPASMVTFNATAVKTPAFWTSPIGPVTAVCGLVAVLTSRRTAVFRWMLLSVALAFAAEVVTVVWVWPMLRAMGIIAGPTKVVADSALVAVTKRWIFLDQLRFVFMVFPSMIAGLLGLQRLHDATR